MNGMEKGIIKRRVKVSFGDMRRGMNERVKNKLKEERLGGLE